jgi:hypothetical protein
MWVTLTDDFNFNIQYCKNRLRIPQFYSNNFDSTRNRMHKPTIKMLILNGGLYCIGLINHICVHLD